MNADIIEVGPTPNLQELLKQMKLSDLADPKCKRAGCYGRGYVGYNKTKGLRELCTCTKKNYAELRRLVEAYNTKLDRQSKTPQGRLHVLWWRFSTFVKNLLHIANKHEIKQTSRRDPKPNS